MKCIKCNEVEITDGITCQDCEKKSQEEFNRKWETCRSCGIKKGEKSDNYVIAGKCRECKEAETNKSDFEDAERNGSISRDNSIMCPYCGDVDSDSWEHNDDNEYTCQSCNKTSDLSVEYTPNYTTTKREE